MVRKKMFKYKVSATTPKNQRKATVTKFTFTKSEAKIVGMKFKKQGFTSIKIRMKNGNY